MSCWISDDNTWRLVRFNHLIDNCGLFPCYNLKFHIRYLLLLLSSLVAIFFVMMIFFLNLKLLVRSAVLFLNRHRVERNCFSFSEFDHTAFVVAGVPLHR